LYCLYSANSVEKPVKGERCSPEMKPSTTARATSSSEPMRASTSGSRKRGGPWAEASCAAPCRAPSPSPFLLRLHHIKRNDERGTMNDELKN
jgi:hypothetical protein